MNILQILPKLEVGGVERGTVDIARYLAANGHKVVVVSGGGALVRSLDEAGIRHYELPVGEKNIFVMLPMVFKLADIIKNEHIDIVHARSRVPALISFFSNRITHRVFITTAHGQYKKHMLSSVMGWGRIVIVASLAMARHMKENFGVPIERIRIIPRGVDLEKFVYENPDDKKHEQFTVGIVSRITPLKGHLTFLKALALASRTINRLKIVIVGAAPPDTDGYMQEIGLLARRFALQDKVEFLGLREDIPKVLSGFDVLVSASDEQEAFGRSIIEAQASGVPCVATSVGGVVDIIEDGITGLLCNPKDPRDMADKILALYRDKNLRREISKAARLKVEKEFSLEGMAKSTLQIYNDCLKKQNILVIKISALGDVILSIPSIRAIRNKFPDAKIKALVGLGARDVLLRCPYLDGTLVCDFENRQRGIKGFLNLVKNIVKEDFDIVVDLQNNKRSHILSFLSFAHKRYGYDNGKFSLLLNHKIKDITPEIDPIEHQSRVLNLLGIYNVDKKLELWPSRDDGLWAKKFLEKNWVTNKKEVLAINIESSPRWESKNWPLENFVDLSERLAKDFGMRVVLIGRENTNPRIEEFLKRAMCKPIVACGRTDILQLAALLGECSLLVTSDSAPMHVAASMQTPFIALFGATNPIRHLAPAAKRIVIKKDIPCSPCYSPRCNKGYKCMTSISVDEVLSKIEEILETPHLRVGNVPNTKDTTGGSL